MERPAPFPSDPHDDDAPGLSSKIMKYEHPLQEPRPPPVAAGHSAAAAAGVARTQLAPTGNTEDL